ncbi:PaaI family thioesterase [Kordia sp.]|uniref:PaaI family thioesterase n=1 Tax=Kordia sp. TaxID=1965332 RepID=UPI003B59B24A
MDHYRKLERMYLTSNMNTQLYETTQMTVADETATISMAIDSKYFHALGAIHGSVYFKLLDDAAFFAVNSIVKDAFVLTTSFNINITRPVSEGKITATGKLKFKSRNLFVAESTLVDEKGREIAFGTGNFAKSRIALTEEIGYK